MCVYFKNSLKKIRELTFSKKPPLPWKIPGCALKLFLAVTDWNKICCKFLDIQFAFSFF